MEANWDGFGGINPSSSNELPAGQPCQLNVDRGPKLARFQELSVPVFRDSNCYSTLNSLGDLAQRRKGIGHRLFGRAYSRW